jgi:putative ABC transport system permease protein
LLERTREVGLMKAMGMTAIEVKRLFLTESMLMGFVGGMLGIFFGFMAGKFISLILSIFGLINGVGFIDVAYLPPAFVGLVFLLSLFVGLITGLYPSRRATKISALDALRYE